MTTVTLKTLKNVDDSAVFGYLIGVSFGVRNFGTGNDLCQLDREKSRLYQKKKYGNESVLLLFLVITVTASFPLPETPISMSVVAAELNGTSEHTYSYDMTPVVTSPVLAVPEVPTVMNEQLSTL